MLSYSGQTTFGYVEVLLVTHFPASGLGDFLPVLSGTYGRRCLRPEEDILLK